MKCIHNAAHRPLKQGPVDEGTLAGLLLASVRIALECYLEANELAQMAQGHSSQSNVV